MSDYILEKVMLLENEINVLKSQDLYESMIMQAYAASAQIILFFVSVLIFFMIWVKFFRHYTKPDNRSDLTSAVLFLTCLPLTISCIGSFILLFDAIEWIVYPDIHIRMQLKDKF